MTNFPKASTTRRGVDKRGMHIGLRSSSGFFPGHLTKSSVLSHQNVYRMHKLKQRKATITIYLTDISKISSLFVWGTLAYVIDCFAFISNTRAQTLLTTFSIFTTGGSLWWWECQRPAQWWRWLPVGLIAAEQLKNQVLVRFTLMAWQLDPCRLVDRCENLKSRYWQRDPQGHICDHSVESSVPRFLLVGRQRRLPLFRKVRSTTHNLAPAL